MAKSLFSKRRRKPDVLEVHSYEHGKTTLEAQDLRKEIATRKFVERYVQHVTILPNPDTVLKNTGKTNSAYEDLLLDAHVESVVQSRKSAVHSLKWDIDANGAGDNIVEICNKTLKRLNLTTLIDQMLDAVYFGYSVAEVLWERTLLGNWEVQDVIVKPRDWFHFDAYNNLRVKVANNNEGVVAPDNRFILIQHGATYVNPYGKAQLSRCYWAVQFKQQFLRYLLKFGEKYGMPYLVGYYTQAGSESAFDSSKPVDPNDLLNDLDTLFEDGVAVVPKDTQVSLLEAAKSSSQDVYLKTITYFNAEISKAILSQTLTTEQGDTGSYAMSQTHLQVRSDVIKADALLIEQAITQLFEYIVSLNFPDNTPAPQFVMYEPSDMGVGIADRDNKLIPLGVKFKKAYIERTYELKPEDFDLSQPEGAAPVASDVPLPEQTTTPTQTQATEQTINTARSMSRAVSNATQTAIPPAQSNEAMEQMTNKIDFIVNNSNSYEEIYAKLGELKDMDNGLLQQRLAHSLFASMLVGRLQ